MICLPVISLEIGRLIIPCSLFWRFTNPYRSVYLHKFKLLRVPVVKQSNARLSKDYALAIDIIKHGI
ncbi:hypothetical protein NIES4103_45290 [Nostoc sp. NIES-4103]|nr:hypothetical protein NIES4103_45290 [Nostoc sp. NIES-4103]